MRIVSVSMVRNEADIIETFVRYHCAIVDAMVIVDHSSVDGTAEILAKLREEGLPLRLEIESGVAQDQSRVVTQEVRRAAREGADLIVPLDADEFLVAPGSSGVRAALEQLPLGTDGVFQTHWITYVPSAGDASAEPNVLKRIVHRRETEAADFRKIIVPGRVMRRRSVALKHGSHGMSRYGWLWHRKIRRTTAPGLAFAHFPVRSVEQLARKVLVGWPANLARADLKGLESGHWRALYMRFRNGQLPADSELPVLAQLYSVGGELQPGSPAVRLVRDPVPPVGHGFELRYGQDESVPLVAILTACMEQMARSMATRRSRTQRPA